MARTITLNVDGKKYKVKDCKGLSCIRGLMFDNIDEYDGALIYANNIWMPFVKHKLKLFFLDENFNVVDRQTAIPITLNPRTWKTYSNKKARYCLEVKIK